MPYTLSMYSIIIKKLHMKEKENEQLRFTRSRDSNAGDKNNTVDRVLIA